MTGAAAAVLFFVPPHLFAARRDFHSDQAVIGVLGYGGEELDRRQAILSSQFGEEGFSEMAVKVMRDTGVKLYVALRGE